MCFMKLDYTIFRLLACLIVCKNITVAQQNLSLTCSVHRFKQQSATGIYIDDNIPSNVINMNGSSQASFILKENHEGETVSFQFRTRLSDQLLFTSVLTPVEDTLDKIEFKIHVAVYLINGSLHFDVENYPKVKTNQIDLNGSPRQTDCVSDYATCADAQWHQIRQSVVKNTLVFTLDNRIPLIHQFQYITSRLSIQEVHLGFIPRSTGLNLFGSSLTVPRQHFQGCIRHLIFKVDEHNFELLSSVKHNYFDSQFSLCQPSDMCANTILSPSVTRGLHKWKAQSSINYVSFVRPGGYIRIPGWHVVLKGEVSFILRTTELNGLLIYGSSVNLEDLTDHAERPSSSRSVPGSGRAGFDIFALELREGYLFCVINTGSGSVQLGRTGSRKQWNTMTFISDGQEHSVKLKFDGGSVLVEVDDKKYMIYTADEKTYKYLNLNGVFYVGGVPEIIRLVSSSISPEVWSIRLRWDYIGCLGDLRVDGRLWDTDLELRACWAKTFVQPHCAAQSTFPICLSGACANGGRCLTGWNRFVCDCRDSNYIGPTCREKPIVAGFNGHQWISVFFSPFPVQSTTEELIIRFQTRHKFGLLFTTRSASLAAADCLELRIDGGYLQLMYNFGEDSKRYRSVTYVSDDIWHTARIQRRERFLNFTVDHYTQVYDIPKAGRFLSHNQIILGRGTRIAEPKSLDLFPNNRFNLPPEEIRLNIFIGNVMAFWFNGLDFLRAAKNLKTRENYAVWQDKMEITASESWLSADSMLEFPLSLETHDSYIRMEIVEAYLEYVLQFWVKADKNFGIILLVDSGPTDLLGLELVNGNLNVLYNNSNQSKSIQSKRNGAIVDSKWHRIQVIRTSGTKSSFTIYVDEETINMDSNTENMSNKQLLLIGGVPREKRETTRYGSFFHSMYGFAGCVASIQISQYNRSTNALAERADTQTSQTGSPDARITTLFSDDRGSTTTWKNVEPGCRQNPNGMRQSANGNCTPRVCQFDGRCVQQWGATRCDCSMTSFTGTYCTEVSSAIRFSVNSTSVLLFELNPAQNTTRDQLAFGIQVVHPNPVVLFLIQGQGDIPDYLEVSIVKLEVRHVLLVRYNMGAGQHTLYEPNVDIGDGKYHIVQFVRDGPSGILRIDLEHERTVIPKETQGTHFNNVKQIHIGVPFKSPPTAEYNSSRLTKAKEFDGFIAGAFFNDVNLFAVLRGLVVPGIYLSEKRNVQTDNEFVPKMEHLNGVRTRSEIHNQVVPNDMKLQNSEEEESQRHRGFHTDPLIVAKPDCVDPGGVYDARTCSPYDRSGIIQPHVEFKRTSVVDENPRNAESRSDWNADQSKVKQNQPNDHESSNLAHGNIYQGYSANKRIEPPSDFLINQFESMNTDAKFPDSPVQRINPVSNQHEENNREEMKLGLSPRKQLALNIGLIASVSVGGICVLVAITCVIYRCMRRDEGSYNVDENLAYTGETSAFSIQSQARTQQEQPHMPLAKCNTNVQMDMIQHLKTVPQEPHDGAGTAKSTLIVSFNDTCAGAMGAKNNVMAHELVSSKQELLSSPSIHSTASATKRSRLVRIESPTDRRVAMSTLKSKSSNKTMTDSQEWYV